MQRTPTGALNPVLADVSSPAGIVRSFGRTIVAAVLPDRHLRHLAASITYTLAVAESKAYLPPSAPTSNSSDLSALRLPVRESANLQSSDQ